MNYKKLNNTVGWIIFIIASFVYLSTMEQTTSLWDCGEYITTANKLEVGHPPGAPFWMMLGRLFSAFASPENAAMMINSMSALSSSFSILFLFWTITMLGRKLAKLGGEVDKNSTIAIIGSGAIGALAYTFTDSFWFSAVEGEVYAMSSFFTAIVFWAILKWDVELDEYKSNGENTGHLAHPNRWILFISYMIGLSIGVHLLVLLAIPAIVFVVYFKTYTFNWKSFFIAGIISLLVLVSVQNIIIPKTVSLADWVERLFTNSFGLPFNSGAFFFLAALLILIVVGLQLTSKKGKSLWNTAILSFALLVIGYSSFVMILVRSNANPPLDENNPETLSQLHSYLQREQYGTWPKLSGQYWNSPPFTDCDEDHLGPDKSSFMKVFSLSTLSTAQEINKSDTAFIKDQLYPLNLHVRFFKSKTPNKLRYSIIEKEISFMNEWDLYDFKSHCDSVNTLLSEKQLPKLLSFDSEIKKEYLNNLEGKKGDKMYMPQYTTLFPRMYRQGEGDKYKVWCGYEGNTNNPLPALSQVDGILRQIYPNQNFDDRYKQYEALSQFARNSNGNDNTAQYIREIATDLYNDGLFLPSFSENMQFLVQYQLNWMYLRYFLWNFSGRQNDTQGYGLTGGNGKILDGNWLSGLNFLDNQRLGDQSNLSDDIKLNKGYNRYFMLPLILGLIGLFYQLYKHPKGWFVVFLLFLLTGIAIVLYLNQKPAEPRERDYAYAASFYAFAVWIGLGVWALFDIGRSITFSQLKKVTLYTLGGSLLVLLVQFMAGNGTVFGLSLTYMCVLSLTVFALMFWLGNKYKKSPILAYVPILLGLVVPGILAFENWDDHDRSNRSTARDFAANYLNSCDYNAILFTNGDNDTFPLWYIQEVEGVRTDVRVANMSLLSTDWHINQMKKRAYESDPLPINMRESVYRSGNRDYVLITNTDNKKYKNNGQRLKMQKILGNLQKLSASTNGDQQAIVNVLKQAFWIKTIGDSLEKDRLDYKAKGISSGTQSIINGGANTPSFLSQANGYIKAVGIQKSLEQMPNMLSNVGKPINKWPERWFSAQEAIDFISDDRNKKFQTFSCNNESYLDFSNVYFEVDVDNAIKNKIINPEDVINPKFKKVIQWRLKGSMLYKADLAVLSLLANYKWDRPIYFASIMGMQANRNLQKHMYCEGLTYKLSPVEYGGNGGTNINKMLALLDGNYTLNKKDDVTDSVGFIWGNMKEPGVLVDYYTMRMVQNLRLQMMKLSDQLIAQNRYDDAIRVLDLTFEEMPIENEQVAADDICYYLCSNYFEAGDSVKGNKIGKELAELQLQRLNYFTSMDDSQLNYVWGQLGKALFNVEMLREASLVGMDQSKMFEADNNGIGSGPVSFAEKGLLANTNYDEICTKMKAVFIENYRQKNAFFNNQQKFPFYYTRLWGGGSN
tara:strand:+ start:192 stop:4415 length:4224 start_codon:yes stop_codon:yes gene_type:complete